jgi:hypothetical protein
MNNFVKTTFSKFIIFKVKSTFEPNAFKDGFHQFQFVFPFLMINVNILSNSEKEQCTFDNEN